MTQRAEPRDPHRDGRATQEVPNPNQKFRKLVSYHNVKTIGPQCLSFSYRANRNSEIQCEVKKKILIGPEIQNVGSKFLPGPEILMSQPS